MPSISSTGFCCSRGVPEIARYDVIRVGKTVPEQLENALKLENHAKDTYRGAIDACIQHKDAVSREIMEKILRETEESVDWTETQLGLIKTIGTELYLQSQMGDAPAEG